MKLHQLRYVTAVAENNLNITAAAERLFTSQPGISKQIRLLEEELGIEIFQRNGKSLSGLTPAGQRVVERARRVLEEIHNIRQISEEMRHEDHGTLSLATTHTQARYVLPPIIQQFQKDYPQVQLHLHQGSNEQIAEMLKNGTADLAIASGSGREFEDLTTIPCYEWDRVLLMPKDHPLAQQETPSLRELAKHPLITYSFSLTDDSSLTRAFRQARLKPNIVLTARDADVIKTYVRLGLGVGIVAEMALEERTDTDLTAINMDHILPGTWTWVGVRKGAFLRQFVLDFVSRCAPQLGAERIQKMLNDSDQPNGAAELTDTEDLDD